MGEQKPIENLPEPRLDSMIVYRSWFETLIKGGKSKREQMRLMRYILEYGFYGIEPETPLKGQMFTAFDTAKPHIDADAKKALRKKAQNEKRSK